MLIFIDRKIYNALKTEEDRNYFIQKEVTDTINNEIENTDKTNFIEISKLEEKDIKEIIYGINDIIKRNEKLIEIYGWDAYYNEDYQAKHHVSGYFHRTGKYIVCPFDWSADDEEDFTSYNFQIAKII